MKVLLVHARYAQPGGEERVVDMQEAVLSANGHRVVRFEEDNATREVASFSGRVRLAADSVWSRAARRDVGAVLIRERPDVMHVHNTFPGLSPSVLAAANAARIPVIQHLHNARLVCIQPFLLRDGRRCDDCVGRTPASGVLHACYRGTRAESAAAAAAQMSHRALGTWRKRVDLFIAVSQSLADVVRAGNVVPTERLAVCHNALADDPGERSAADDAGYALFAGRLSPEKGVSTLIEAAARTPDLPVVIAGDGPQRRALESGAPRNVRFVGHLDQTELRALMRGARVAIAPSIGEEPFGMTVIEAAAMGVPTIATRVGALPEIIDDGVNGILVAPAQPALLAGALERARDHVAMAALGAAARRQFVARFTADAYAARLLSLYASVL